MKIILFFCFFLNMLGIIPGTAVLAQKDSTIQAQDKDYIEVVKKRADKIVFELGLSDPGKAEKVSGIVANQYRRLNAVYTERDTLISHAKRNQQDKAALDAEVLEIKKSIQPALAGLHTRYLAALSALLTPEQVDRIKDGMTYGVVQVTYHGYVDMIPSLKEAEKKQIMDWLVEAREYAMDAESSEQKHAWFGKYKGRINNYLSKQGYDSKKEREEWMKRLKEKEKAKG